MPKSGQACGSGIPDFDDVMHKEVFLNQKLGDIESEISRRHGEIQVMHEEVIKLENRIEENSRLNNGFLTYVSKRKESTELIPINLSDYFKHQLNIADTYRASLLTAYAKMNEDLQDKLSAKVKILSQCQQELNTRNELKILREKQEEEITGLKTTLKGAHLDLASKLQEMRTLVTEQRQRIDIEAAKSLQVLSDKTTENCETALFNRIGRVLKENESLLGSIRRITNELVQHQKHKTFLQEKWATLKQESLYVTDLSHLEDTRQVGLKLPRLIF